GRHAPPRSRPGHRALGTLRRLDPGRAVDRLGRHGGGRHRVRRAPGGLRPQRVRRAAPAHHRDRPAADGPAHPHRADPGARCQAGRHARDPHPRHRAHRALGLERDPAPARGLAGRLPVPEPAGAADRPAAQDDRAALGCRTALASLLRDHRRRAPARLWARLHHRAARVRRQHGQQGARAGQHPVPAGLRRRRQPVHRRRPCGAGRRRGLPHRARDLPEGPLPGAAAPAHAGLSPCRDAGAPDHDGVRSRPGRCRARRLAPDDPLAHGAEGLERRGGLRVLQLRVRPSRDPAGGRQQGHPRDGGASSPGASGRSAAL
ncbi:MAG: probable amidase, partial [uncultured Ramlibacter sp.]